MYNYSSTFTTFEIAEYFQGFGNLQTYRNDETSLFLTVENKEAAREVLDVMSKQKLPFMIKTYEQYLEEKVTFAAPHNPKPVKKRVELSYISPENSPKRRKTIEFQVATPHTNGTANHVFPPQPPPAKQESTQFPECTIF